MLVTQTRPSVCVVLIVVGVLVCAVHVCVYVCVHVCVPPCVLCKIVVVGKCI